jgi:hypothetical protein
MYLIEILLPVNDRHGKPFAAESYRAFRESRSTAHGGTNAASASKTFSIRTKFSSVPSGRKALEHVPQLQSDQDRDQSKSNRIGHPHQIVGLSSP